MNLKDRMNLNVYVDEISDDATRRKKNTDALIALICIVTAALAFFFNQIISAAILGTMFLLLGINGLNFNKIHNAFPEKNFPPAAFMVLGLALGVVPVLGTLLIRFGSFRDDTMWILFALPEGILILILGIIITAYPLYFAAAKKRRCTCYVTATCISPICVRQIRGTPIYEHLWEFTLNGETVHVSDRIPVTTEKPYPDMVEHFIVNPDDPNDLYRKRPFLALFVMFLGIMVCIIAVLPLISVFILLFR